MSDESVTVKARTYAFFLLSLMVDKTNAAWKDVKIPAGNFPKGFEQCEALTIDQIVQILQVTIKKKLQDIVDGNTGGENGGGETPTNPHPPIECADAAAFFTFHTNLGIFSVQASVNGGPWKDINDQPALDHTHVATTVGGLYMVALSEGLPATRVQIKTSSPVAFYFNELKNIDDGEQDNQSFGLYDAADKFVNPFLPENWVQNSPYLDDPDTDEDYCVMFSAADFCLKYSEGAPVGCEGAINSFKSQYITDGGLYEVSVNDQLFTGTHWMFRNDVLKNHLATFGVILNAYSEYNEPVSMGPDGRYEGANIGEFINTSNQYVKLKISIIDAGSINIPWVPINKTAVWDADQYVLTVCLAPQGEEAVDAHCYNIPQSEIDDILSGGQSYIFLNNASGNYGLQVFSPAQFYITANGQTVNVYEGGGGAQWGTDTDPNISITDADGYLQFRNKTSSEMVIRICSRTPIPVDNRPIYQAVLGSDGNNMIVRTDDDGYQTCVIKLSPAG